MKFIRKALWPTAIVAAFLMLFGALGNAINADTLGNVQSSTGDNVVEADEEVAIYVLVAGDVSDVDADAVAVVDAVGALAAADTAAAIILTENALEKAVKKFFVDDDGNFEEVNERQAADATDDTPAVTQIDYTGDDNGTDMNVIFGDAGDAGLVGALETMVIARIAAEAAADAETSTTTISGLITARENVNTAVDRLEALPGLASSEDDVTADAEYTVEVDGNAEIIEVLTGPDKLTAQASGRTRVGGISPVTITAGEAVQKDFDLTDKTSVLLVVVECTSGSFEISFESNAAGGLRESAEFQCQGAVAGAEIAASKSTVYSADSAKSVITVTIEDEDGTAATPGGDVDFTTNACVFGNDKNAQEVQSEADGDDTTAEATLDCSGADAAVLSRLRL